MTGVKSQGEKERCAVLRALYGASECLLRAPEDATLVELCGLRRRLEALARQALQTSAAQPAGASTTTGKTSTTIENSIAATGKPDAAPSEAASSSSVRALALAKASVALRSTFPADESLVAALTGAAAREVQACPPDGRQALALAYLHAATYAEGWRRASESLLRQLPSDALTREARTLLAELEVAV